MAAFRGDNVIEPSKESEDTRPLTMADAILPAPTNPIRVTVQDSHTPRKSAVYYPIAGSLAHALRVPIRTTSFTNPGGSCPGAWDSSYGHDNMDGGSHLQSGLVRGPVGTHSNPDEKPRASVASRFLGAAQRASNLDGTATRVCRFVHFRRA